MWFIKENLKKRKKRRRNMIKKYFKNLKIFIFFYVGEKINEFEKMGNINFPQFLCIYLFYFIFLPMISWSTS